MVSVLMSVYNEEISVFLQAIRSIQNQTEKDLQILIIIDNPNRFDLIQIVRKIEDKRIQWFVNSENMGLANSINKLASYACGEYLARMDADDIAYPSRIEKEINLIQQLDADYVCTQFEQIDEANKKMKRQRKQFRNPAVNYLLPYTDTICHPTVLIKAKVFRAIGGYRDLPCAQDYDLWLRLFDAGYRVAIVEETLLSYRVRSNGISAQKGLQQFYTAEYIRQLSKERHKHGYDSFSPENYHGFLEKNGVQDPKKMAQWKNAQKKREEKGRIYYLILSFYNKENRRIFLNGIRIRILECWFQLQDFIYTCKK